jgi:hypothetical protein
MSVISLVGSIGTPELMIMFLIVVAVVVYVLYLLTKIANKK